ncbi:hypothetical protein [Streptomyces sp. NBC_00820]|uniref:hypothetical protein n=1 Tax=Streptomyces sp. NBC_00820 TaxID=2975842 RepID=UPI002ED5123E
MFTAPPRSAAELGERYAELARAETARGREAEFDRIELIRSAAALDGLDGPRADYLEPVVRRHDLTSD